MSDKILLEQFRDLIINRDELERQGGQDLLKEMSDVVVICNQHLVELLEGYINGQVTENRIHEWVNTVWFSDAFDYCDEGSDCIASIMNKLEELDEGFVLNVDVASNFIVALKKNREI
ncbi:hypothetical protein ACR6HW_08945 [Fusibacter sp. JL298sf-3]